MQQNSSKFSLPLVRTFSAADHERGLDGDLVLQGAVVGAVPVQGDHGPLLGAGLAHGDLAPEDGIAVLCRMLLSDSRSHLGVIMMS